MQSLVSQAKAIVRWIYDHLTSLGQWLTKWCQRDHTSPQLQPVVEARMDSTKTALSNPSDFPHLVCFCTSLNEQGTDRKIATFTLLSNKKPGATLLWHDALREEMRAYQVTHKVQSVILELFTISWTGSGYKVSKETHRMGHPDEGRKWWRKENPFFHTSSRDPGKVVSHQALEQEIDVSWILHEHKDAVMAELALLREPVLGSPL